MSGLYNFVTIELTHHNKIILFIKLTGLHVYYRQLIPSNKTHHRDIIQLYFFFYQINKFTFRQVIH